MLNLADQNTHIKALTGKVNEVSGRDRSSSLAWTAGRMDSCQSGLLWNPKRYQPADVPLGSSRSLLYPLPHAANGATPRGAQGTIWSTRDCTLVGGVQGKHPAGCILPRPPLHMLA